MIQAGNQIGRGIGVPANEAGNSKALKDLKKACEQFEAVFAKQLLGEMRKGVQETTFGDQAGAAIYKDMMDQSIADTIAQQGSLGIGQMLYKQFEKQVSGGDMPVSAPAKPEPAGDKNVPATKGTHL